MVTHITGIGTYYTQSVEHRLHIRTAERQEALMQKGLEVDAFHFWIGEASSRVWMLRTLPKQQCRPL